MGQVIRGFIGATVMLALLAVSPLAQVRTVGSQFLPHGCTNGQVPAYNTTTRVWDCADGGGGGTWGSITGTLSSQTDLQAALDGKASLDDDVSFASVVIEGSANNIEIGGSATGLPVSIQASGDDANIPLSLSAKITDGFAPVIVGDGKYLPGVLGAFSNQGLVISSEAADFQMLTYNGNGGNIQYYVTGGVPGVPSALPNNTGLQNVQWEADVAGGFNQLTVAEFFMTLSGSGGKWEFMGYDKDYVSGMFLTFLPATSPSPTRTIVGRSVATDEVVIRGAALTVPSVAFAGLPATGVAGMVVRITDSDTSTWGATISGGGGDSVLAFYNGSNWTVMGK